MADSNSPKSGSWSAIGGSGRGSKKNGGGAAKRPSRTMALRRQPSSGIARMRYEVRRRWEAVLEMSWLWVALFVLLGGWCLIPRHMLRVDRLEVGQIASRTFLAEELISIPNEAATRDVQQSAAEKALPVYDLDRGLESERRRALGVLFTTGRELLAPVPEGLESGGEVVTPPSGSETAPDESAEATLEAIAVRLSEASGLKVTPPQVELMRARDFSTELEDRLAGVLTRILRVGVVSDKALLLENRVGGVTLRELPDGRLRSEVDLFRYLDYPEEVETTVEQDLRSWDGISRRERRLFAQFLLSNLVPNLTFNSSETLSRREAAVAEVGTVFHQIHEGEVIVRRGDRADEMAAAAVAAMAGTRDGEQVATVLLGTFLLLLGSVVLLWLRARRVHRSDRSQHRVLAEGLLLLVVQLIGVRFAYLVAEALSGALHRPPFNSFSSYTYAIPFASLGLMAVLLYGRTTAGVMSVVFSLLVGRIAGDGGWEVTVYCLVGSLAGIYALDRVQFRQRSAANRAGLIVGLANVVAVVMLRALSGDLGTGLPQIGFDLLCALVGGLLASAVTSFAVPILESLLSVTTYIKLIELANPNLPLLRRLAFEAPGTFQHSLAVGNLSKAGVEAIGGDSLLVHTGALYHDIGKILRPHYYIENQVSGQNPHDKIQPSMSALIIINHVKEGLELAVQNRLPQPIFDAIEQHHGTRLIKFFLNRAKERCDPDTDEVRDDDFRYPGPKPQTPEMGVLMLADAVEAASRTLVEPSRQKLRGLVRTIFDDCLQDGQLDDTDLTLRDLRLVEEAFLRVLTNIHHRRIDYPGFDFNRPGGKSSGGREKRRSEETAPSARDSESQRKAS